MKFGSNPFNANMSRFLVFCENNPNVENACDTIALANSIFSENTSFLAHDNYAKILKDFSNNSISVEAAMLTSKFNEFILYIKDMPKAADIYSIIGHSIIDQNSTQAIFSALVVGFIICLINNSNFSTQEFLENLNAYGPESNGLVADFLFFIFKLLYNIKYTVINFQQLSLEEQESFAQFKMVRILLQSSSDLCGGSEIFLTDVKKIHSQLITSQINRPVDNVNADHHADAKENQDGLPPEAETR